MRAEESVTLWSGLPSRPAKAAAHSFPSSIFTLLRGGGGVWKTRAISRYAEKASLWSSIEDGRAHSFLLEPGYSLFILAGGPVMSVISKIIIYHFSQISIFDGGN